MKIVSEVQVVPVKPVDGLVGFASFVLYESIYCGSVGVYTRPEGGYRLTFPKRKVSGRVMSVYYPITRLLGRTIEEVVVKRYEEVVRPENDRYGSTNS